MIIEKGRAPSIEPTIEKNPSKDDPKDRPIHIRIFPFRNISPFSEEGVQFQGGPQKRTGYKLALWTWFSASIDTLIMLASSCFFLIAFSWIMQTQFTSFVVEIKNQISMLQMFAMAFLVSFWSYLVFMRVFNSATIGESSCSLRLGQPAERLKMNYILKVILRTTLIMTTGIFPLPLLSLILGRDLAGQFVGLKIYSLK